MPTTKKTTAPKKATKPAAKAAPAKKEAAPKKAKTAAHAAYEEAHAAAPEITTAPAAPAYDFALPKADGKYFYAVGRRKTSVANVRLFFGKDANKVNGRDFKAYFGASFLPAALKPLNLTGLEGQVYIYVNANGGGVHSQAHATAHGIAQAIVKAVPDFRKVLKKNAMLTRDSRMKERKKPGLKRARRGPQWAKR